MPKNSFLQAIFPKLKYSVSPVEKTNKGTTQIGKVIPVYATMLQGKESISLDLGHLVRFLPTNVPVMEGYEVNFEAFKVSLNAIAYAGRQERNVMDFHNLALNDGSEVNPFSHYLYKVQPRIKGLHAGVYQGDFYRPGLLGDYLNFPAMKAFRDYVRSWITKTPLFEGGFESRRNLYGPASHDASLIPYQDLIARYFLNAESLRDADAYEIQFSDGNATDDYVISTPFLASSQVDYPSTYAYWTSDDMGDISDVFGFDVVDDGSAYGNIMLSGVRSLFRYICDNYPKVAEYYNVSAFDATQPLILAAIPIVWKEREKNGSFTLNYLDVLYRYYKVDAQSVFEDWFNQLVAQLLFQDTLCNAVFEEGIYQLTDDTLMSLGYLPDVYGDDMKPVDWTYFAAYWKIISDWYINTNIDGDPDVFYLNKCRLLDPNDMNLYVELEPFTRRWANDIFTSAVPSSLVNDVVIPANTTIPELRNMNAMQRIRDILRNTGGRLRDVLYGIRGYRPSAMASHMAVPCGTLHSFVGISSVLQTTPTTQDSAQGNMSGIGVDSSHGRHICKIINNDEPVPVVVMIMMSVTQRASYMQGFPRQFFRTSIYDFAIPQLANVGEQEVMSSEVYFDYSENADSLPLDSIFGFNRRYYDWFFEGNEIHGEMRDSQDYWHGARIFDSTPALNSEFIGMDNKVDHLSRIFANQSPASMPIYYNVAISGEKIVTLPRYIQYDL